MISDFKGHEMVNSLTTLNSPHHGISLIQRLVENPQMFPFDYYEPAIGITGLTMANITEYVSSNMEAFNKVVKDHPDVGYYSVGSSSRTGNVSNSLKFSQLMIEDFEGYFCLRDWLQRGYQNDGILYWPETQHGILIILLKQ